MEENKDAENEIIFLNNTTCVHVYDGKATRGKEFPKDGENLPELRQWTVLVQGAHHEAGDAGQEEARREDRLPANDVHQQ